MAKKAKPKAKPKAARPVKKAVKKSAPKKAKAAALECGVCGYRVFVDGSTGIVEERALLCCGVPMVKV